MMKKNKEASLLSYIKVDMYRCFCSWKFLAAIIGVILVSIIAIYSEDSDINSTIQIFCFVEGSMSSLLIMIFAAVPYADCFCDDYENKNNFLQIIRGNLKKYFFSKTLIIVISAIFTTIIGLIIFAIILRSFTPWFTNNGIDGGIAKMSAIGKYIVSGNYLTFIFLYSLQLSIYLAVLSLIASFISLFISNRLLVLSTPIVASRILSYYSGIIFGKNAFTIGQLCNAEKGLWGNNIKSYVYPILIAIIMIVFVQALIYLKLKRRVESE